MLPYLFIAIVLLVTALWMHAHQRRLANRLEAHSEMPPAKARYLSSQIRRRTKVTYLVFALALGFVFGGVIRDPMIFIAYWMAILALVMWMLLLGLVDAISTWSYLSVQRDQQAARKRALEEEARHKTSSGRESSS
ncbi:MAG: hypothetical protein WD045_00225 [Pirellulaceae bacterium]